MTSVQSKHFIFELRLSGLADGGLAMKRRLGLENVGLQERERDDDGGSAVKKAVQKKRTTTDFGARLREKRLEKKISLRAFSDMIGVSSTYLSQVEQGRYDPPTADRVTQIAKILGEDADLWIGLANRVPDDMEEIVKEHPKEMPELMRAARGLSPEQFAKLQQMIKRLKAKGEE